MHFLQLSQYASSSLANSVPGEMMVDQNTRSYLTLGNNPGPQAPMTNGSVGHVTLNPYHYQNYGEDLHDGLAATLHLRDSVYMSPQLVKLTNTLRTKKKMCQGSHPDQENACHESDVVFRAVSPHGHVYWEIEPKTCQNSQSYLRPNEAIYVSSRQSSSRYSDNHPLISSSTGSSGSTMGNAETNGTILVNPFADVQLLPVTTSATSSPLHYKPEMKFGSLRSTSTSGFPPASKLFSNRSNSARAAKMRDIAKQIEQMRIIQQNVNTTSTSGGPSTSSGSTSPSNSAVINVPEQIQQQIQIRDLKTLSMTSSSGHPNHSSDQNNQHFLAKVQNVMNEEVNGAILNRNSPKQRKV